MTLKLQRKTEIKISNWSYVYPPDFDNGKPIHISDLNVSLKQFSYDGDAKSKVVYVKGWDLFQR